MKRERRVSKTRITFTPPSPSFQSAKTPRMRILVIFLQRSNQEALTLLTRGSHLTDKARREKSFNKTMQAPTTEHSDSERIRMQFMVSAEKRCKCSAAQALAHPSDPL